MGVSVTGCYGGRTFSFNGEPVLSHIPQLAALYAENEAELAELDAFVGACEAQLCDVLRKGAVPSSSLVDAIATCKVRAVESRVTRVWMIRGLQ